MATDYQRQRDEAARRRQAIVSGRRQDAQERQRREAAARRLEARYREQQIQEAGWRRTAETRQTYRT